MTRYAHRPTLAALAAITLLSGCATKSFVREEIAALESRQNARMDGIEKTAQDALARALAAGKLAEGKFNYSIELRDDSVKFPSGNARLSPQAESTLASLAQKLIADNRNVFLEIQGHTDAMGSPDANIRLGEARAQAARRYLAQQNIPTSRMSTISYGEAAPVADNATAEGRAANRRIVIVVMN